MSEPIIIPPAGRYATELAPGARLRIVQPEGEQVADLIAVNRDDHREKLSMQQSRAVGLTYKFVGGHTLYSSLTRPMLAIDEDDTGENYCGGGYCSTHLNMVRYGIDDTPSCEANLEAGLLPYGMDRFSFNPDNVFNIFMTVAYDADGTWEIRLPKGKPGDAMTLRALMPQIVSISNCPMTLNACNNYRLKPLTVQILDAVTA